MAVPIAIRAPLPDDTSHLMDCARRGVPEEPMLSRGEPPMSVEGCSGKSLSSVEEGDARSRLERVPVVLFHYVLEYLEVCDVLPGLLCVSTVLRTRVGAPGAIKLLRLDDPDRLRTALKLLGPAGWASLHTLKVNIRGSLPPNDIRLLGQRLSVVGPRLRHLAIADCIRGGSIRTDGDWLVAIRLVLALPTGAWPSLETLSLRVRVSASPDVRLSDTHHLSPAPAAQGGLPNVWRLRLAAGAHAEERERALDFLRATLPDTLRELDLLVGYDDGVARALQPYLPTLRALRLTNLEPFRYVLPPLPAVRQLSLHGAFTVDLSTCPQLQELSLGKKWPQLAPAPPAAAAAASAPPSWPALQTLVLGGIPCPESLALLRLCCGRLLTLDCCGGDVPFHLRAEDVTVHIDPDPSLADAVEYIAKVLEDTQAHVCRFSYPHEWPALALKLEAELPPTRAASVILTFSGTRRLLADFSMVSRSTVTSSTPARGTARPSTQTQRTVGSFAPAQRSASPSTFGRRVQWTFETVPREPSPELSVFVRGP